MQSRVNACFGEKNGSQSGAGACFGGQKNLQNFAENALGGRNFQSRVKIRLKMRCIIGVLGFERRKKQKIVLKIHAKSAEFLDYAELCAWLKKTYKERKFGLLEESLEFVFADIKAHFPAIKSLKISVCKPKIIKGARVSCYLKRKFTDKA